MEDQKCKPISTLSEGQRVLACSELLTIYVATHPDLGCGYFAFLTLRWPIQVDPLHPDQRSGYSSILTLLLK